MKALALRKIETKPFAGRMAGFPPLDAGPLPSLRWIRIALLRIDPTYQREIGRRGEANILAIVRDFDWAKFSPLIVAPMADGLYVIIDGQHHATAAALRGFDSVPCLVVTADRRKQAAAFAAVNGNVTAMTPLQLHAARVAAGEPKALALAEACTAAGVSICRYPVPGNKMKAGETLAVSMLRGLLDKYGRDVFVAALSCITRTRQGNVGMIRSAIAEALCAVLEAEPTWWEDDKRLIRVMQAFDFPAAFNAARAASVTGGGTICDALIQSIGDHLEARLTGKAA